jgi:hypothetical protein
MKESKMAKQGGTAKARIATKGKALKKPAPPAAGKGKTAAGKAPVDPKHVFRAAVSYEYSANLLASITSMIAGRSGKLTASPPEAMPPTAAPATALGGFAIELYLKCLLQLESGASLPPGGHPLVDLFSRVSSPRQAEIKRVYDENRPSLAQVELAFFEKFRYPHALDFDRHLGVLSRAFERWRYYYELEMEGGLMVPGSISYAVQQVILQLRPEWASILNNPKVILGLSNR